MDHSIYQAGEKTALGRLYAIILLVQQGIELEMFLR